MVRGEQGYYLWEHLIASLQRIGVGVGFAIVFGIPLGLLMSTVKWVSTAWSPTSTSCGRSPRWATSAC